MNYISLNEIKDDLLKYFKNQSLYPVLGAGFSFGCKAKKGCVPSGDELKNEMLTQISDIEPDISSISSQNLKNIASYYKKLVSREIRTKYLLNNFTCITLPEHAINFLKINWKYIYTFNIDTCIEENSNFKNVILPNKSCDENNIKSMHNCIFKVHGDVNDYCKYTDSKCYIFDNKEYIQSIKNNIFILNKMQHDFTYNNLIFIGCSLTDELDLLSINNDKEKRIQTSRYFVTNEKPDRFKELNLIDYGITDVILIDDYVTFYQNIYNIFLESEKTYYDDELSNFKNLTLNPVGETYDENISYLCYSKSLFDEKNFTLNMPYFFTDRELILDKVIPEMSKYNIQFICGGRVSGKTYALASIAKFIQNQDVYFFDSRYSLNSDTLDKLLKTNNSIICFDTTSISKDQIYYIKENIKAICENSLNIIICINSSDKDIILSIKRMLNNEQVALYDLNNKFTEEECIDLNKKLSQLTIPSFKFKKNILDNLLLISNLLSEKSSKINLNFEVSSIYTMNVLILLAIKEKLTSQEFVDFGVEREVYDLVYKLTPIIDEDYTNILERDSLNASPYKIYVNSKYWLLSKLGSYASDSKKHRLIIDAFHNIIEHLIQNYNIKYNLIEDYIKYDIINEIFFRPVRGNLLLIKSLYDDLNDLLYYNPQFHHQRAKCYLWHCNYSNNKESEIRDALRFAKLAKHNLELQANVNNSKVIISLAHIDFTLALIYAKINSIYDYMDKNYFKESLPYLKNALSSPYNKNFFHNLLQQNNKKINDINLFVSHVTTTDLSYLKLSTTEKRLIDDIINIIHSAKNNR